jgi:hypothetical protein
MKGTAMNEKDLAKPLLALSTSDLTLLPDVDVQTHRVLRRDRRRVKIAAVFALLLWGTSLASSSWCVHAVIDLYSGIREAGGADVDPMIVGIFRFLMIGAASMVSLSFAVLCTLLMMMWSRRATLRQINVNLAAISRQLNEMQPPPR